METLIYIGLFSILMSGAVVATYNLLEGGNRNIASVGVQEEGTFLNRKINWALAGASAASVFGGTTLTITRPDLGAQSPLVITGNGATMTIARGAGGLAIELNSDRFAVSAPSSGPTFSIQPASGGRPASVTASFVIQGKPFIFRTYLRQ
jgi:hypothetical protein